MEAKALERSAPKHVREALWEALRVLPQLLMVDRNASRPPEDALEVLATISDPPLCR